MKRLLMCTVFAMATSLPAVAQGPPPANVQPESVESSTN